MEVELLIRQALTSDAQVIISLLEQVQQETHFVQMEMHTVEQQEKLLNQYAQATYSIMLVAELSGQVIGIANLIAQSAEVAELGVCVIQDYWGYGIGTALVADLLDFAEEVGLARIELEVLRENERAIRLYQSFAFSEKHQHSTADSLYMTRQL